MKTFKQFTESLWANIHKKRQRIKRGFGEKMRKKGEKGAPTPAQMQRAKGEGVQEDGHTQLAKTNARQKKEVERLKAKHNQQDQLAKVRDARTRPEETDLKMKGKKMGDHLDDMLKKHKRGEKIGVTALARLKARGLIPRADGTKKKGKLGKS